MHINWNSRVTLPVYEEPWLTQSVSAIVREATDDDALAAFLHFYEGALVRLILEKLQKFHRLAEEEHKRATKLGPRRPDSPVWAQFRHRGRELAESLHADCSWAQEAVASAEEILDGVREEAGAIAASRFRRTPESDCGLERAIRLERELEEARLRFAAAMQEHAQQAHELALREEEFRTFRASAGSISIAQLHAMTPYEFEHATAVLARRDGYEVVRGKGGSHDLGADVIALTSDARKIVFQCKHRQPGSRAVGSRVIQTLNGTARPVHNADIVVAVTNGSFSKPASSLAAEQGIYLMYGDQLERWATWGIPLLEVLGDPGEAGAEA
ncbi:restriction endonuclease [Streptomyces violaceoruber]|uniref:restriction endonuclease n=1 Tax=Streptomyces TaxID=1883 RepID=UPI0029AD6736|nr:MULTISPECIES: restriction endonuclease [Streptomyces]MDX3350507.1 restriction endonuclease [Streptomyces sp. ME02-6979A]